LLGGEGIEDAVEDHLSKEELIAGADLARDTALEGDDVLGGAKVEATEATLAVLELVEVHDALSRRDALLQVADPIGLGLLQGVLIVELGQAFGVVQGALQQSSFERLNFLRARASLNVLVTLPTAAAHLDELFEGLVLYAHILDGIEEGDALGEATLDLDDVLKRIGPRLGRLEVLAEEYPDVRDAVEGREQHGDHAVLALFARLRRSDPVGHGRRALALARAARGDVEEDVDDVLLLRRFVRQRSSLCGRVRTSQWTRDRSATNAPWVRGACCS
jgi:hypothetical protein